MIGGDNGSDGNVLKSKGDGVYNILGEAVIIVDGQVKSRQVIQPKVDKKGWFD